jgi:AbiV family abortive infection protein
MRRPKPYFSAVDTRQAAAAMQAARLNSIDLLDTADILHSLKRFPHSVFFSILAIEEAGKLAILQALLHGFEDQSKLWKSYRSHRAKTESLNLGIFARIRATFPAISLDEAHAIAARGPTPDDLEEEKQRAVYSDCLDIAGKGFTAHLPQNAEWREAAWNRLCEARAIVLAPRDRSPEELDVWVKHVNMAKAAGRSLADVLPDIHRELVEKGFIEEGWWDAIVKDMAKGHESREPG